MNALVIVPDSVLTVLKSDTTDVLGKLRAELNNFVPDVTTRKGREEIASKARKVSVAKADVERAGKKQKEDAQAKIKSINEELKPFCERMDALRDQVRKPLDDFEAVEESRVRLHETILDHMRALLAFAEPEPSAGTIADRLQQLQALANREWQEFDEQASTLHASIVDRLATMHANALQREKDRAELAALRAAADERARLDRIREQAEHERRIAEQAATQARQQAEAQAAEDKRLEADRVAAETRRLEAQAQLERDRADRQLVEAAEKAERAETARLDAIKQAEQDRERARQAGIAAAKQAEENEREAVAAERRRVAEKAAQEQQEADKRAADKAHRAGFNRQALEDLQTAGLEREQALAVLTAIARGTVRHVSIKY